MAQELTSIDTIVALSTPPGESGVGVIRVSGPGAVDIVGRITTSVPGKSIRERTPFMLHRVSIAERSGPVDDAMIAFMKQPKSYTGEDMIEITAHGSPVILKKIIFLLIAHGARMAEPGEFTKRAFLNGKMDLLQAEAVADLIRAKTDEAAKAAHVHMSGGLSRRIQIIKESIIDLLARYEALLDHPDEDVAALNPASVQERISGIIQQLHELLSTALRGRILKEGITCAIIGRPNVGKSSLLNALIGRERAIVTDEPGTTRDTVDAVFQIRGIPLTVVDTAGIRTHAYSKAEHLGIERSRQAVHNAQFILSVFDSSSALTEDDNTVIELAREHQGIMVLNKSDKKQHIADKAFKSCMTNVAQVSISALTGEGIGTLTEMMYAAILKNAPTPESSVIITSVRHENILRETKEAVERSLSAFNRKDPDECIAFELKSALSMLDEITGVTTDQDILNKIFAEFCIGK